MLAGATTIDLVMLVIAADDGIMPQTIEHFEIARLLGIRHGLVVINKRDLVDGDWIAMVKGDIKALVRGSFLENAPILAVSATTGEGIPELRAELDRQIAATPAKPDRGIFRLPIDRNFMMRGFGTVVAGTVLSGRVQVGDRVELLPEDIEARIRGIQVHNKPVESALLGERAALNLQGIEREMVLRGSVLATPGYYRPSEYLDASFYLLKSMGAPLKNMTRLAPAHRYRRDHVPRCFARQKEMTAGAGRLRATETGDADRGGLGRPLRRAHLLAATDHRRRSDSRSESAQSPKIRYGGRNPAQSGRVRFGYEHRRAATAQERPYDQDHGATGARHGAQPGRYREDCQRTAGYGQTAIIRARGQATAGRDRDLAKARNQVLETLTRFHHENPVRLGMKRQELRSKAASDFHPITVRTQILEELAAEGIIVIETEKIRLASHQFGWMMRDQRLAEQNRSDL